MSKGTLKFFHAIERSPAGIFLAALSIYRMLRCYKFYQAKYIHYNRNGKPSMDKAFRNGRYSCFCYPILILFFFLSTTMNMAICNTRAMALVSQRATASNRSPYSPQNK